MSSSKECTDSTSAIIWPSLKRMTGCWIRGLPAVGNARVRGKSLCARCVRRGPVVGCNGDSVAGQPEFGGGAAMAGVCRSASPKTLRCIAHFMHSSTIIRECRLPPTTIWAEWAG